MVTNYDAAGGDRTSDVGAETGGVEGARDPLVKAGGPFGDGGTAEGEKAEIDEAGDDVEEDDRGAAEQAEQSGSSDWRSGAVRRGSWLDGCGQNVEGEKVDSTKGAAGSGDER